MSKWAKKLNYKIIIFFFTVLACAILTVYFALFLSFFLCISYILVTYPLTNRLLIDVVERSVIFVLVAYVIGLVCEKQAKGEEKLRETKDYLDDIIKSSADANAVVAMEGIVRSWNKAAEDYMDYTAEEIIGTDNNFFSLLCQKGINERWEEKDAEEEDIDCGRCDIIYARNAGGYIWT